VSHRPEWEKTQLRALQIGMLMQSGTLLDHLSIRENLELQLHLSRRGDRGSIGRLLEVLGIAAQADQLPRSLSGGEVARAGLAVALVTQAPVLLCDEPTAEVDALSEAAILEEIQHRRGAGTAVLIATHSMAVAAIANRLVRLSDGQVVDG
jgi:putative ABC transport system ATP-binding protein